LIVPERLDDVLLKFKEGRHFMWTVREQTREPIRITQEIATWKVKILIFKVTSTEIEYDIPAKILRDLTIFVHTYERFFYLSIERF